MRILVTGSSGVIGKATIARLTAEGHETRPFDIQEGDDLRSFEQVRKAVEGCNAIVHAGAIPGDAPGRELEVVESNAQGTWNILFSALHEGIKRVVHFSSIQALGYVGGHHAPVYFPVDDDYPRHPMTPYQLGKHLGEETCKTFARRWGMEIVSLRPMAVTRMERCWADIPHRTPMEEWFRDNPYRTLVDCSGIKNVLGWSPKRSWRD
ncbi:MAG: NAD(P)-dependent oxidoreductase [Armatimonadetes bacterium]|nr:NAD(P)-dependent oxidoreductase [Armatimonadota bacterium]